MSHRLAAALLRYLERPRPTIVLPEIPMQFSIAIILTKLCGVAPDMAELVGLWVKAKSAKSPGGKTLTDEEKADLTAALRELIEDLKN